MKHLGPLKNGGQQVAPGGLQPPSPHPPEKGRLDLPTSPLRTFGSITTVLTTGVPTCSSTRQGRLPLETEPLGVSLIMGPWFRDMSSSYRTRGTLWTVLLLRVACVSTLQRKRSNLSNQVHYVYAVFLCNDYTSVKLFLQTGK